MFFSLDFDYGTCHRYTIQVQGLELKLRLVVDESKLVLCSRFVDKLGCLLHDLEEIDFVSLLKEIISQAKLVYILTRKLRVRKFQNPCLSPPKMTDMKGSTSGVKDFHALHKQWDDTSCPICLDHPHNAILLICSSHDKGCRSYICDTSYRHSNCLDRFKKLKVSNNENINSLPNSSLDNSEARTRRNLVETHENYNIDESNNRITTGMVEELEGNNSSTGEERTAVEVSSGGNAPELDCLKCPLCRGNVLGLMVVKEARQYLDLKLRSCSRESCSFSGNYRELRRHARRIHPSTRPSDVDPTRQRAWHRLEHQREHGDILSAVRSAMPGAIVLGDYVIDSGDALAHDRENIGSDEGWWPTFFMFHMLGSPIGSPGEPRGSSRTWRTHRRSSNNRNLWGENLLGLRDDDDDRNLDEDIPIPRRRRRFMRSRPDEE